MKHTQLKANVDPELTSIWEIYAAQAHHKSETKNWNASNTPAQPHSRQNFDDLNLIEPLGQGGMGVVHLAKQTSLGREVAVKMLREEKRDQHQAQKLIHEAKITARLDHPNIIPVYSMGVDPSHPHAPLYVMKKVEGVNWKQVIRNDTELPTLLNTQDDLLDGHLAILEHVCRAVHYAHSKGIVHLDLKTDNVMLGSFGEVYVVDWGISALYLPDQNDPDAAGLPHTSDIKNPKGTPGFMAPEIVAAQGELVGPATDIYLLGGLLHYILTKQTRHQGATLYLVLNSAYTSAPYDYPPDVPPMLAKICNKAMSREPLNRYKSAEEFRQAIATFRRQREGVALLQSARNTLKLLITHGTQEHSQIVTSHMYQKYGELNFALERAKKLGVSNTAGVQGAALRVMFDMELSKENAAAARELLGQANQWSGKDTQRISMLEELETQLADKEAWVQHMRTEQSDNDVSISQKTRGWIILAMTLIWATVAAVGRTLLYKNILPNTPESLILLKGINTLLAIALSLVAPHLMKLNQVNRRLFTTLSLVMSAGLITRGICLWQGVPEHISLVMESLLAAVCISMLGLFVERKLLLVIPFFMLSIIFSLWMPTRAWEMMIVWNMSGLILMSGLWIILQKKQSVTKP